RRPVLDAPPRREADPGPSPRAARSHVTAAPRPGRHRLRGEGLRCGGRPDIMGAPPAVPRAPPSGAVLGGRTAVVAVRGAQGARDAQRAEAQPARVEPGEASALPGVPTPG